MKLIIGRKYKCTGKGHMAGSGWYKDRVFTLKSYDPTSSGIVLWPLEKYKGSTAGIFIHACTLVPNTWKGVLT